MSSIPIWIKQIMLIAMGGGVGAVLRYVVAAGVHQLTSREFPYGTLVVNIVGSLLIGLFAIFLLEKTSQSANLRALIIIGGLGGFTTFSTFSYETVSLIQHGALMRAILNVSGHVMCCLLATWVGLVCGRWLSY